MRLGGRATPNFVALGSGRKEFWLKCASDVTLPMTGAPLAARDLWRAKSHPQTLNEMANDPASWLDEFARRVLEEEHAAGSKAEYTGAFAACEKLRQPLRKMLGAEGFQSLLSRAVALAGAKAPWLLALKAKSNGMLGGLEELRPKPEPRTVAEGEALILAELLGLLITFVGPSITLGLTQEIWPTLKIWKT